MPFIDPEISMKIDKNHPFADSLSISIFEGFRKNMK
jgi:hypothetical protein